ncbi:MAG: TolC family protein [Gemmatimonadaceae bacterium]|nr:TolC family protein [Gemmatimonadaceae bacterium]
MRSVHHVTLAVLAALAVVLPRCVPAQGGPIDLAEALRRADEAGFANRRARAAVATQRAATIAALRGVLPTMRIEAGIARTTDPIGAFGTLLRQRAITQQDFEPTRLNYPSAVTNHLGGLVFEQPLFNADAWVGRRAAAQAHDAASATAAWTLTGQRVEVIRAYYGAVLAAEKLATLGVALQAAREHLRFAETLARNGVVTSADAMLAGVKAGDIETQLVAAKGELAIARLAFATVLGTPDDETLTLPSRLPAADALRRFAQRSDTSMIAGRQDVRAANAGANAAAMDVRRARSLYVPRLNGFARYDWNSALRPFDGQKNWTVGVMASWTPFAGASEIGDRLASEGRLREAEAMRDGAVAESALDLARAESRWSVNLARLDIVERMVRQSTDAQRIVARRYEGGLGTIAELLDAQAAATQAQLTLVAARFDVIIATAERLRARGLDPATLRVLDDLAPDADAR